MSETRLLCIFSNINHKYPFRLKVDHIITTSWSVYVPRLSGLMHPPDSRVGICVPALTLYIGTCRLLLFGNRVQRCSLIRHGEDESICFVFFPGRFAWNALRISHPYHTFNVIFIFFHYFFLASEAVTSCPVFSQFIH